MIGIGTSGDVPLAFIDADHAAGVAGDAVVGEEVGRVGEDEVDAGWGDGGEDVEAVALEDFDVMLGVVEDGGAGGGDGGEDGGAVAWEDLEGRLGVVEEGGGGGGARSFGFDGWRGEMR